MGTIRHFEDLECWHKARKLANAIYDLTEGTRFAKDFRLRDQIQAAAGSVMHNIAEGFDSGYNPEFIRFLKIARRSASEVQSELNLALDRKYVTQEQMDAVYNLATEAKQLMNAFIAYLREHGSASNKQRSDDPTKKPPND
ncbi:MAG: four helix bundle protein [Bacteroidota bacterium]|jgi:four helix bundle protein